MTWEPKNKLDDEDVDVSDDDDKDRDDDDKSKYKSAKTFLKSPLNFSLPLQFQEIFSYFSNFQYLVKLINFIQM